MTYVFTRLRRQITFNKHRNTLTLRCAQKRFKLLDDSVQVRALWMEEIDFVSLEWSQPLLFTVNRLSVKTSRSWLRSRSRCPRMRKKNFDNRRRLERRISHDHESLLEAHLVSLCLSSFVQFNAPRVKYFSRSPTVCFDLLLEELSESELFVRDRAD